MRLLQRFVNFPLLHVMTCPCIILVTSDKASSQYIDIIQDTDTSESCRLAKITNADCETYVFLLPVSKFYPAR